MARRACHTSFYCFQGLKEPTLALNSQPSDLHLLRAEMTGTGRHPQLCHAHTAQCPTLSVNGWITVLLGSQLYLHWNVRPARGVWSEKSF